ncbi:FG-GAP repeat protein [Fuerstiella marisgermanici]|uniref:Flagellin n=1 Tax=Fuerstiella marisgermanici TaxID=1891926 RepID=A0A1P8WPE3_9PLAN|nr:FG-GAP repeat protein [Fuerstiella marisgermanici]APZ95908.1 Flagellin [Fuerstiella marisgermanici]
MLLKDWLKCLTGERRSQRRLMSASWRHAETSASVQLLEPRQLLSATNSLSESSLADISGPQLAVIKTGVHSELAISIADDVNRRVQIAGLRTAIANSEKAVTLVQTAEGAVEAIESLLIEVRNLTIDSADTGVHHQDVLAANQLEIEYALDAIDRIANSTQFGRKVLLDGSASVEATSTNSAVSFLRGTSDTTVGMYFMTVTTAAERAHVSASTAQGDSILAGDETLTVNDVELTLTAGLTQNQVVDRINEFTTQTGVKAEIDTANGGVTRLFSEDFGKDAEVFAISNVAASESSSGIGTDVLRDDGEDIVATVGGSSFNGSGNLLTVDSGAAKGLSIQIAASSDAVTTGTAVTSTLFVTDNTLQFQIGPNANQTASLSIDRVNPVALGFGIGGNRFHNLSEIDVTSTGRSQDSLSVVDSAINDIINLRVKLRAFRTYTLEATANSLRTTLEIMVNAESVISVPHFPRIFAHISVGGAGDINGDGFDDLIIRSSFTGETYVVFGGKLTLRLDGDAFSFDIDNSQSSTIAGVEAIDISGSGANTLTLNALDVLELSRDSNTLMVFRDRHDTVNIGTGWTQQPDEIAGAATFEVFTLGAATLKVQESDTVGDLDGDGDFDANDSFLIHLIQLSGTGLQIEQSKGNGLLTATQIRSAATKLNAASDVDGDGDFDASDSFLIHLVKLAGTDTQIDQSKGRSSLSAAKIRANINALSGVTVPAEADANSVLLKSDQLTVPERSSVVEMVQPTTTFAGIELSERELFEFVRSVTDVVPNAPTAVSEWNSVPQSVWDDFRHWIDAI